MSNERPEGWTEPVHDALMRPASFFGAAPRGVVFVSYGIAAAVAIAAGMQKAWIFVGAACVGAALVQVATASLTYLEAHWFSLLSEWLCSPSSKVDP